MKKISKIFVAITSLFALSLSACSGLFNPENWNHLSSGGSSDNEEDYGYKDTFVDTNGVTHHVSLNKKDIYLLPGTSETLIFTLYKEGEEPLYNETRTVTSLQWKVDDTSIATSSEKETKAVTVVTGVGVGETKIHVTMFQSRNVGTNATIHVLEKKLTSIVLRNTKTTYLLNSEFKPRFNCFGIYSEKVEEEVNFDDVVVDSSKVNMAVATAANQTYPVTVSYTYKGVTMSATYGIKVVDNPTYTAKDLTYDVNDLNRFRSGGGHCPNKGNVKTLVIPIWFKDSDNYITTASEKTKIIYDLQKAFYGDADPETGWNSVKSFYSSASKGSLNLTGTVSNWYNSDYYISDFNTDAGTKIKALLNSAVDWYFACNPSDDPFTYDYDHNNYFDGIYLIYGVPDSDDNHPEVPDTFWGKISFAYNLRVPDSEKPGINFHMWASYDSLYEDNSHTTTDTHVYTHEFGHTLGLSDYYDYSSDKYYPVGGHAMMFHNTGEQDPYSTLSLGYSKVIVPETSCVLEIDDFQSGNTAILLSNSPESVNSPFDEYILVELYAPNGLNKFDSTFSWKNIYTRGSSEPCVRFWHVDARLAYQNSTSYSFTNNPYQDGSFIAFTNSWGENHGTNLGRDYDDYCELFDIRKSTTLTYRPKSSDPGCMFDDTSVFKSGDTFSQADYANQFKNGTKLNNGNELGWTVNIESIYANGTGGYTASLVLDYSY